MQSSTPNNLKEKQAFRWISDKTSLESFNQLEIFFPTVYDTCMFEQEKIFELCDVTMTSHKWRQNVFRVDFRV